MCDCMMYKKQEQNFLETLVIVDLCFWEDVNYNVCFFCSVVLDPALLGASEKRLCRVLQEDARLLPAGTEV